jgi:hypothetical protein
VGSGMARSCPEVAWCWLEVKREHTKLPALAIAKRNCQIQQKDETFCQSGMLCKKVCVFKLRGARLMIRAGQFSRPSDTAGEKV